MSKFSHAFKTTVIVLMAASLITACGGRKAMPVAINQSGDNQMSCQTLDNEMKNCRQEITSLIPQSKKTGKNVALGIAGALVFAPALFFMDMGTAEKTELEAYRQRHNHLLSLADGKHCGLQAKRIEPPKPAKDESNKVVV